jgi:3-hydroxyisobutyrate dehydrogenase
MGFELVKRLLAADWSVAVWNRSVSKARPLTELGARLVDAPTDLSGCEMVVTMVSSSDAFEEVTLGTSGVLSGDAPRILIDCSTVSVDSSERVRVAAAKRGTTLLAAPVSGNPKVVRSGQLSVVVSGPADAYHRAAPLLEAFGRGVTHVGEGDRARLVKICHNLILGTVAQSLAETAILAEKGGVSRADYLSFINQSVLGSVFSRYKTPAFVNLDYAPTFTSHLLRKDFELGLAAGRELDAPLPLSALVHQLVVQLSNSEFGDQDFAALLELQARSAGFEVDPENVPVSDGLEADNVEESE